MEPPALSWRSLTEVSLILLQPSIGEFGRPRLPVTEEIAGFKSRWEDTLVL